MHPLDSASEIGLHRTKYSQPLQWHSHANRKRGCTRILPTIIAKYATVTSFIIKTQADIICLTWPYSPKVNRAQCFWQRAGYNSRYTLSTCGVICQSTRPRSEKLAMKQTKNGTPTQTSVEKRYSNSDFATRTKRSKKPLAFCWIWTYGSWVSASFCV